MTRFPTRLLAAAAGAILATAAHAAADGVLRIGVLTDLSGLYVDIGGPGAVAAIRMAVEDFGGSVLGKRIEVVAADTLNEQARCRGLDRPACRRAVTALPPPEAVARFAREP